ncbi:MAG: response regulator transcription factor [Lachnospiraceae bacterium]|nr:response regulator transcription factor [Lachnospiraceae bacterium]
MMKILLLEDDENLADALVYSLKGEGITAVRADCIAAAQELLGAESFDLALLDVMLPDGDGYGLCEWIRKRDASLPVIFLTALEDESNVVRGFGAGADDYVSKPFRMGELVARIRANVRRSGGGQEKKLDDTRLCIWKKDERIDLAPGEYKLLKLLMEENGRTVSKERILERLWGGDVSGMDDHAVPVYIRRLRDKLDGGAAKSCIGTVRGEGYRWEGWT